MDKSEFLLDCGLAFGWLAVTVGIVGLVWMNFHPAHENPEFYFKGKPYVVVGLQGAGYTHEHKSPVYTLVVISKEDSKKWTKK